jgi:hypothetical protein
MSSALYIVRAPTIPNTAPRIRNSPIAIPDMVSDTTGVMYPDIRRRNPANKNTAPEIINIPSPSLIVMNMAPQTITITAAMRKNFVFSNSRISDIHTKDPERR